jgi:hypothetical protein
LLKAQSSKLKGVKRSLFPLSFQLSAFSLSLLKAQSSKLKGVKRSLFPLSLQLSAFSFALLLLGCGVSEFPGRQSPFTGASDVPFVPTYNFSFTVGFSGVSGPDANLVIISQGDLLNFVSAANIIQRPGMGVITGVVQGFGLSAVVQGFGPRATVTGLRPSPAENVILQLTDAEGNTVGDVFYNGIGGTPDFVQTSGTTSTGLFTIFNVPPGEVFLKAIGGGRGNTRLRAFADSVSLATLQVVRVGVPTLGVLSSIGESNETIPDVALGVALIGGPADQDSDGVTNDQDFCPNTGALNPVDQQGCAENQTPDQETSLDIGLLSASDSRGFARFSLDAEGDFLIKLFDDRVYHTDTYHELNTSRAQLAGTQAADLTKFFMVYLNEHIKIFQKLAGVVPIAGRGMIFGKITTSDGTPVAGVKLNVTDTTGQTLEELGGKVVYTDLAGDPVPTFNTTSQDGGYMVFNVPIKPMFLTATADIFADGPIIRSAATAMVFPVPDSVYVKDLILFQIPGPVPDSPQIPPVFTVTLDGQIKKGFGPDPVEGAKISALGVSGTLATTDSEGNYTIARTVDPAETGPLLAGGRYFLKVSHTQTDIYQDTYQEFRMGSTSETTPLGDMILFDRQTIDQYLASVGEQQDPENGILIGTLFDLDALRATGGVSIVVRDASANEVGQVYYFDEDTQMPAPADRLPETSRNGKYIVFNLPPGPVFVDVNSPDDNGNDVAHVFAGGITVKNVGVNNAPSPSVQVQGTVHELGGSMVGNVTLSALGGDLQNGTNGQHVPLKGLSGSDGRFQFAQSTYTQQVIRAQRDSSYLETYNFDFSTLDEPLENTELLIVRRSEMDELAEQAGIQIDTRKGIILGEIRVIDFDTDKIRSFCTADGTAGDCITTNPVAMVSDYINEDLVLDLAILQQGESVNSTPGSVAIYFGNGDGTFRYSGSSTVGLGPVAIDSADFNRDGSPDIVVLNSDSATFSVMMGSRAGRYVSNPPQYAINSSRPVAIALGDHDGDRNLDLLIADRDDNIVSIFLGDGRGNFAELIQSNPRIPVSLPPCGPVDLALIDLDSDILLDWVVACSDNNSLAVLEGDSGFTVSSLPDLHPTRMVLADFNEDGLNDIAVIGEDLENTGKGKVAVVMSDGANQVYSLDSPPRDIALANFDFDGFLDLVVTEKDPPAVKVLFGRSGGSFEDPISLTVGEAPGALVVSDFDRNGGSDFVVVDEGTQQATVVFAKEVLADHHPKTQATDFEGNVLGEVHYFTTDDTLTSDASQGDGRFLIFNVTPGLTVVKTTSGGSGNKTITVYPDSVSYVKTLVQRGIFGNAFVAVSGVTVDAVTRPVGDVDISFMGAGTETFSTPVAVQQGSIVGGAEYDVFLEVNSEYIVRLTKIGGGGAPPVPGDFDFDSIPDNLDDCPGAFNPDQTDTDGDNIGDVCDPTPTGR